MTPVKSTNNNLATLTKFARQAARQNLTETDILRFYIHRAGTVYAKNKNQERQPLEENDRRVELIKSILYNIIFLIIN